MLLNDPMVKGLPSTKIAIDSVTYPWDQRVIHFICHAKEQPVIIILTWVEQVIHCVLPTVYLM